MKSVWRQRNAGVCRTSTTLRDLGHFVLRVDVGEHRKLQVLLHLREDPQALAHSRAAIRLAARPVRLVVRRLEDERDAERARHLLELARHVHLQLFALDHAGPAIRKNGLSRPASKPHSFIKP
jgi:hypothetical protein